MHQSQDSNVKNKIQAEPPAGAVLDVAILAAEARCNVECKA